MTPPVAGVWVEGFVSMQLACYGFLTCGVHLGRDLGEHALCVEAFANVPLDVPLG